MYNQPGQYSQPYQGQPGQYGQPYRSRPDQYYCQPYTVKQGDTFNTLANQYGISVDLLATANPNANLQRGQNICIPISGRRY
jgi:LysM repeat protein